MVVEAYGQEHVGHEDALAVHSHASDPQSNVFSIFLVGSHLNQHDVDGLVNEKGVEERVGDPLDEDEV